MQANLFEAVADWMLAVIAVFAGLVVAGAILRLFWSWNRSVRSSMRRLVGTRRIRHAMPPPSWPRMARRILAN